MINDSPEQVAHLDAEECAWNVGTWVVSSLTNTITTRKHFACPRTHFPPATRYTLPPTSPNILPHTTTDGGNREKERERFPTVADRSEVVRSLSTLARCPTIETGHSFQDALRTFFQPIKNDDPRLDFYTMYKREATEYDTDYVKKYDEDLNTTLIFVRTQPLSVSICLTYP